MGADENVEIVRGWFEEMNEETVRAELFTPQVTMENLESFPIRGPYIGPEGVRQWLDDLSEVIEGMRIDLIDVSAADDRHVVTLQRMTGTFKSTGIPVDETWAGLIRFDDGLIAAIAGHPSRTAAREAIDA